MQLGGAAAFQREIASRRQLLGRSAGVERRLGALLSLDDLRVERRANGEASSVMTAECAAGRCAKQIAVLKGDWFEQCPAQVTSVTDALRGAPSGAVSRLA